MCSSLAIAVITMNRAEQLRDALISCLKCELPINTKFIIIDNASTDNTRQVVMEVMKPSGLEFYYEKMESNLGVGGGRNYAFSKSDCKYTYILDDDAVISDQSDFFKRAIELMDANTRIATLTTQIYDEAWKANRVENNHVASGINGVCLCKSFCGGSHFLRNSYFNEQPYLPNKYGFEELLPSFIVYDKGYINAFVPDLLVIHRPLVNKWNYTDEKNHSLIINECAVPFAIKKMMYPKYIFPLLKVFYILRCNKYLKNIDLGKEKSNQVVIDTTLAYPITQKIKLKTLLFLVRKFGISVL